MHATDIVGYTFNGHNYFPEAIIGAMPLGEGEAFDGWGLGEGINIPVEDNLADLARSFGIDREDETSYDSSEFPKVIFASQIDSEEDRMLDSTGNLRTCAEYYF